MANFRYTREIKYFWQNNQLWGGKNNSTLHWAASHHPIVDCFFPVTAHPKVFYSLVRRFAMKTFHQTTSFYSTISQLPQRWAGHTDFSYRDGVQSEDFRSLYGRKYLKKKKAFSWCTRIGTKGKATPHLCCSGTVATSCRR